MGRVYNFRDPMDMIELGNEITSELYWKNSFRIESPTEDDPDRFEQVDFRYFYEYCDHAFTIDNYDGVKLSNGWVEFVHIKDK